MPDDISRVLPGLWLGAAITTVPDRIQAIINLTEGGEAAFRLPGGVFVRWLAAPIPDRQFRGLAWLDSTVDTVLRWRQEGLSVLIHCAAGVSRSALVMTAVLMKDHQIPAKRALALVKHARPQVNPNPHFQEGLLEYEQFLRQGWENAY